MINKEIYTDPLGREGVRWQTGDDRYVFMPSVLPNPHDIQIDILNQLGQGMENFLLREDGSAEYNGCHFPYPYIAQIETVNYKLFSAMFGIRLDPNVHENVSTAGFIVTENQTVDSVAFTFTGDSIDITKIHSVTFESNKIGNEYALYQSNDPSAARFVVRKRPLDYEFGLPFMRLFRTNISAAVSDMNETIDLLGNGITTDKSMEQLGKLLTYIHRDIYFPTK